MTLIAYLQGDETNPSTPGQKIIAHGCNDIGGFSGALSRRYPEAEVLYRQWSRGDLLKPFKLGEVQFVKCARPGAQPDYLWVANIISQVGVRSDTIRYDALRTGLRRVFLEASLLRASVHLPRLGCGDWREVERIIAHELAANAVPVMVYDLP